MKRREFVQMGLTAPLISSSVISPLSLGTAYPKAEGNSEISHSICQWCYSDTPLELLCEKATDLGIQSIELLHQHQWATVLKKGLNCAVGYANDFGLQRGFNDTALHQSLAKDYIKAIQSASEQGIPQLIAFSGNRSGRSDEEGIENCARGLDLIIREAEKRNIIITMELLNSKIDHPDYQCDRTAWAVKLVDKIGSPNFKLLYDIYHMQIMEGDVIRTITQYKDYISHFHTGGVPGRHEIDESQELNYSAIVKAIKMTGFTGYIAQEFIPSWDRPFDALARAIEICKV